MRCNMLLLLLILSLTLSACGKPREVTIDITDELICQAQFLTNQSDECMSVNGCDDMCFNQGCSSYSMKYISSEFTDGKCRCLCIAPNKISTVASYYETNES